MAEEQDRPGGIPGIPLLVGIAGAVLLNSGLYGRSIKDSLQRMIRGRPLQPEDGAAFGSTVGGTVAGQAALMAGTATGRAVAQTAAGYIGVPYQWGGETPAGWDCSGFVTWVLHHDFGITLPDNVHTTAAGFWAWSGATTIPRSACSPGDLVCWVSHIGIATDADHMINAPTFGQRTQADSIWAVPAPVIRRPKAYG